MLRIWVNIFSKEIQVAPTLLLPRDTMEGITLHGVSILQTWRRELMLQRLKAFPTRTRVYCTGKWQTAITGISIVSKGPV